MCSPIGFGYDLHALDDKPNELNQAFNTMFNVITKISTQVDIALRYAIPVLDRFVSTPASSRAGVTSLDRAAGKGHGPCT